MHGCAHRALRRARAPEDARTRMLSEHTLSFLLLLHHGKMIIIILLLLFNIVPSSQHQCVNLEVENLLHLLNDGHTVLVKFDKENDPSLINKVAHEAFQDLCTRYEQSPEERIGKFVVGRITFENFQDSSGNNYKNIDLDIDGDGDMSSIVDDLHLGFPAILILQQKHSTMTTAMANPEKETSLSLAEQILRNINIAPYSGDLETITGENLAEFIKERTNVRVGMYIYSLDFMDRLASRFIISIQSKDQIEILDFLLETRR